MTTPSPAPAPPGGRLDGRRTRWEQHRAQRRRDLVDSTLRAIRQHGAGVGMDDIAAAAATSKTVIYRHFGDRTGVYLAVVEAVDARILADLERATAGTDPADVTAVVAAMARAYLTLVAKDPEIYRFVVNRPLVDGPVEDDPVSGLTDRIAGELAASITAHWAGAEVDPVRAQVWAAGLVGFVRTVADRWLAAGATRPAADIVADVIDLFEPAFAQAPPSPQHREKDHG